MKKLIYVGLGTMLLFGVASADAMTFGAGESYSLNTAEVVNDNLYAAGGSVNISGNVEGDVLTAGGDIFVTGNVSEDLMVAGGSIDLQGDVGDDLRFAGGDVSVSGNVGGEVIGVGGQLLLLPSAVVAGDLNLNGGSVRLDGNIGGNVIVNGGEVFINGVIDGNVVVRADVIELGPNAVLDGDFEYYSESEAFFDEGAAVLGEVNFHQVEAKVSKDKFGSFDIVGFVTGFTIIKASLFSIAALLFALLWRKWANNLTTDTVKNFWKRALAGFATLVLTPVAVFILFITVIGAVPAIVLMLGYILSMVLASVFAGILLAALANKYLFKKPVKDLEWWKVVLGVFAYNLLKFIPFVGWLAALVIFLASLGWILNSVYMVLAKARK